MQEVIEDLKEVLGALQGYHDSFRERIISELGDKKIHYKGAYPIAVVHSKTRIKEPHIVASLASRGLFDGEGLTPSSWSREDLEFLQYNCEAYIQESSIMALACEPSYPRTFTNKYPKDRWKKFQDVEHVIATIEMAAFGEEADKCALEFYLREVMRKRKEVSVLKGVGYLYIAQIPKSVEGASEVFAHYFKEQVAMIEHENVTYFMGWSEKLKDINMRYFVCKPEM